MLRIVPLVFGTLVGSLLVREHRARRKVERLSAATLETLLDAVEANDAETGQHVRRVAAYALELAKAAELDESEQRSVERVALFHDIGKIHEAIYDVIHDADKLTPEEREQVRTHPARGANVLKPLSSFYPDLEAGVLAHHERWDGTGYPNGTSGTDIPLTARIVSIADTFDAITQSRRYSGARSIEQARQAIVEGRGTQFDPELVDLFLSAPVLECVAEVMREHDTTPKRKPKRRSDRREVDAPDITFRWRRQEPSRQQQGL